VASSGSGPLLGPLGTAPPLAMLAAAAAVASLVLNRLVLRSLGTTVPHDRLVTLGQWSGVPRNLTAIAGIVALTGAIYHLLRLRRVAPVFRRMLIAAFAGIFLPIATFATFFPVPTVRMAHVLVLLALASSSILAILVTLVAVRWRGPVGLRVSVALFGLSALCALGATVAPLFLGPQMWHVSRPLVRVLGGAGEVTYLLAPLAAVPSIRPLYPPRRALVGRVLGAAVGMAVIGAFVWGQRALRGDFPVVFYGAQRLELLLDTSPWIYALPLGVGFGIGAAALVSTSAPDRQAGAGLLLLLSAGHAPSAPVLFLMMALGATLMARSLIAQALAIETTRVEGAAATAG
jgi:hypothetical protein